MNNGHHHWAFVGDTAISFTTAGQLEDGEWDRFIADLKSKPVARYLATNLGTIEVSSVQRKKFTDFSKTKPFPLAVVTDEKLVRGLVTAISWVGVNVKAFSWKELKAAVDHLGVPKGGQSSVYDGIRTLMQKAGSREDLYRLSGV